MKMESLVSRYTVAKYRPQRNTCNDAETANMLQRDFNNHPYRSTVVPKLLCYHVTMH
jgi:hypothetical protein